MNDKSLRSDTPSLGRIDDATRLAPILFATTNLAKFAQARLVLGSYGFEVEQLFAHEKEYREPYGEPLQRFLLTGLHEVVHRAGKGRLVFIEDSTVHIPGLSPDGDDFPGQRTKEWLPTVHHEQILTILAQTDPGRRAYVRSDIALHVPHVNRAILFRGVTEGTITKLLPIVKDNPLYPWLGRQDFSSWFIPDGATRTLAEMDYEESTAFDFRARSLLQLAERLREYEAVLAAPMVQRRRTTRKLEPSNQMSLLASDRSDLLLVVGGKSCTGKTAIGHHLALKHGFHHVDGSNPLFRQRSESSSRYSVEPPIPGGNKRLGGEFVSEHEIVWTDFLYSGGPHVFTGPTSIETIAKLYERAHNFHVNFRIVYVTAPEMLRRSWNVERCRASADFSQAAMGAPNEMINLLWDNYGDIVADAILRNSHDFGALLRAIDRLVPRIIGHDGTARNTRRRSDLVRFLADVAGGVASQASVNAHKELILPNAVPVQLNSAGHAVWCLASRGV